MVRETAPVLGAIREVIQGVFETVRARWMAACETPRSAAAFRVDKPIEPNIASARRCVRIARGRCCLRHALNLHCAVISGRREEVARHLEPRAGAALRAMPPEPDAETLSSVTLADG